jgi:hypothetical protein
MANHFLEDYRETGLSVTPLSVEKSSWGREEALDRCLLIWRCSPRKGAFMLRDPRPQIAFF